MAQPTNTHDRYDLNANGDNVREDLADIIHNIDPDEVPFCSNASRGKSGSDLKEWLKDNLAAVDTGNAHIDGDDFTGDALTAPVRLQNYHQIMKKEITLSRRANKLTKAGRKSEVTYELAKQGKSLKRDKEAILTRNQVAAAGNSTTAPTAGSLDAWLASNTDRGVGGADPTLSGTNDGYPNAAATDGTARALSEADIHTLMSSAYVAGGSPNTLMMGAVMKSRFSNWMFDASARIATPYQDHGSKKAGLTVIGAVDVFVTDYGVLDVVPNRFQRERDVFLLDMKLWELSYIDDMLVEEIAKSGDSQKRHIITDVTLCSKQEAGSAIYADADETTAMVA